MIFIPDHFGIGRYQFIEAFEFIEPWLKHAKKMPAKLYSIYNQKNEFVGQIGLGVVGGLPRYGFNKIMLSRLESQHNSILIKQLACNTARISGYIPTHKINRNIIMLDFIYNLFSMGLLCITDTTSFGVSHNPIKELRQVLSTRDCLNACIKEHGSFYNDLISDPVFFPINTDANWHTRKKIIDASVGSDGLVKRSFDVDVFKKAHTPKLQGTGPVNIAFFNIYGVNHRFWRGPSTGTSYIMKDMRGVDPYNHFNILQKYNIIKKRTKEVWGIS